MKTRILIYITLLITLVFGRGLVAAQDGAPEGEEPYAGQTLCAPDVYLVDPGDCLPLGPSQLLTDMARKGISIPPKPLPAAPLGAEMMELSLKYGKLNVDNWDAVGVFPSIEAAVEGSSPGWRIPPGVTRYISYEHQSYVNDKPYLQLESGEWVRASPTEFSPFTGLVFSSTPKGDFGWIVEDTQPSRAPGYDAPKIDKTLTRETLVTVYDTQVVGDIEWSMIGFNEWVDRQHIRRVIVNTTPPQGVDNQRWIEINLYEQTLAVYENGELRFATLITTGAKPYYTQPGLFKIYQKLPYETMQGAFAADKSDFYYLMDVPWTMYFDKARALHGAYWRTMFGYTASHGCVNLSVSDARWLFDWANVGDWVYVWDISGETPTDPTVYGDGGA
jgi:lipoprotein-anchoring transpeptidase ErfK/SrfK